MDHSAFQHWTREIVSASMRHCHDGMYVGEEGAKRFAREVGASLPDFSKEENDLRDMMSGTYSAICVIAYNLKPPIDAKLWLEEMRKGIRAVLNVVPTPMPLNYQPAPQRMDSSPESYRAMWRGSENRD